MTGLVLIVLLVSGGASESTPQSLQASLAAALAADLTGEGHAANAALARLSDTPESRRALGLDLVEAWWRVSHRERAINTLSKWRQEAPRSPDPIVRARARALTGSPFDVDATWPTFTGPDASPEARCHLLSVAQALDAVGRRDTGQRLLDRAWAEVDCPDDAAQRATWERPRVAPPASPRLAPPAERRHVLGPGHEARVVRIMPEQGGELPAGVGLMDLSVPEVRVEALYGPLRGGARDCADAPLCVTLHHPSVAQPGDRLAGAFALRVGGRGVHDPEALLDGISTRILAEGDWDPWEATTRPVPRSTPDPPVEDAAAISPPSESPDKRVWVIAALVFVMGVIGVSRWARRGSEGA